MAFSKNFGSANSTSKGRWRSGEVEDAVLKYVDLVVDVKCRCWYCWWLKSGVHQLRLVVHPITDRVSYIPGGAGFQPSTVLFPLALTTWLVPHFPPPESSTWHFQNGLLRVAKFGRQHQIQKQKSNAFMVPWPTHARTTLINPYDSCTTTIPHQRPWTPVINLMQYSLIKSAGISLLERCVMPENYHLHVKQRR